LYTILHFIINSTSYTITCLLGIRLVLSNFHEVIKGKTYVQTFMKWSKAKHTYVCITNKQRQQSKGVKQC